jgi:single-strand DNA-binding protein
LNDAQLTFAGNLADAPELRFTPNGKATARMRVAVNERRRDNTGEWVDGQTSWHTVIAWGKLAENAAATLTKGTRVLVHGRLSARDWATEAGEKRTSWEITADEIGASLRHGTSEHGGTSATWETAQPEPAHAGV